MLDVLEGGEAARDEVHKVVEFVAAQQPPAVRHPLSDVTLDAPLPRPRSIRDCMVFEKHLVQAMRTVLKWRAPPLAWLDRQLSRTFGQGFLRVPRVWKQRPIYYKGNPQSVVGTNVDVRWPTFTERLDYELEFGIVVGRRGRDLRVADADQFVAGFTVFNDFSARDIQMVEMSGRLGPAKSKDFDTGNVLGPFLVTPNEIPDPYALKMLASVNGECWSEGTSGDMHFSFAEILAAISESETLVPGDFIGSGTVPGGCGLELDRWLAPGDVVELEVEGIGKLSNRVVRDHEASSENSNRWSRSDSSVPPPPALRG
jgi:2-keto-4-pentenoate hydratase/2-oxohepta-3-ene-1,7-dioic acid hydratase in catechol pathway